MFCWEADWGWETSRVEDLKEQLNRPGLMRIDIFRVKTSCENIVKYYTFIGEDGENALKRRLTIRAKSSANQRQRTLPSSEQSGGKKSDPQQPTQPENTW
ncbi:MAG: hypothetical protein QXJ75_03840 [Candidatus Bathyarchaeia archaeon]